MPPNHEKHLTEIVEQTSKLLSDKYSRGFLEHGGELWNKHGLLDMAIDEAIDQVVYLLTLKQQLDGTFEELLNEDAADN